MSVRYLDLQTVVEINEAVGGEGGGVRDAAVIDSAVARPRHGFGDVEFYPTLWDKAAALLHGLASTQGFHDGNKRTAWVACRTFLELNGWPLDPVKPVAGEVFVLAASASLIELPTVAEWLREHSSGGGEVQAARSPFGHFEMDTEPPHADVVVWKRPSRDRVVVNAFRGAVTPENVDRPIEERDLERLAAFSMERRRFVNAFSQAIATLNAPEPPRNAPCPCGSGRKYKHCHGVSAGA